MIDSIFLWFITGIFAGAIFALLAFALCAMSKKSRFTTRMDKEFENWIKDIRRRRNDNT